ncbi:transporter substrate-binding domain-containing protein [Photobacterium sp. J15]|uniref:transporter substrate-binding domain-containing protein n=1 Tax=Photobacterium sp. J15 TaxID=265901 RepID=UPI000A5A4DC1|nr:transporter substrate-binding domain-containing protein [Photobacterium sp. J15]
MIRILLFTMFCLVITNHCNAETAHKLKIGTKVSPPFAMKNDKEQWIGISIDLWRELALQNNLSYEFVETDLKGLINLVSNNQLDASIAAITITHTREQQVDFSHAYFTTGLAIAVPAEQNSAWRKVIAGFFSRDFIKVVFLLCSLLAILGTVIWLIERKKNQEQFGGTPLEGIGSGFWWAAVTMTTVGYGDKAPKTITGRFIALIWMFAAIILISSITAAITTSLTLSELTSTVQGPQDLNRVRVGTLKNSSSEAYLVSIDANFKHYPTLQQALARLLTGEIDAVLYDSPILKFEINRHFKQKITLIPGEFEPQAYGIAIQTNSPLREQLNRSILSLKEQPSWKEILYRYQG